MQQPYPLGQCLCAIADHGLLNYEYGNALLEFCWILYILIDVQVGAKSVQLHAYM